jgi:hypothetical protein
MRTVLCRFCDPLKRVLVSSVIRTQDPLASKGTCKECVDLDREHTDISQLESHVKNPSNNQAKILNIRVKVGK